MPSVLIREHLARNNLGRVLDVCSRILLTTSPYAKTGIRSWESGVGACHTHRSISHNLIGTNPRSWIDADLFGQHLVPLRVCGHLGGVARVGAGRSEERR